MAELGLKEGEWLHASKPALRGGMRPTFALKTRVWCCGILHAHGYQSQCAYTMFRNQRVPLTAAHIVKELQDVAIAFYADAGKTLNDQEKAALKVSKQHIRRVLAELEREGLAERLTADGPPVRELTGSDAKRLHHGKIRLYFFARPRAADLSESAKQVAKNGYFRLAYLSPKDDRILRRLLNRSQFLLPADAVIDPNLQSEIQVALTGYLEAEQVAAQQLINQLLVAMERKRSEINPGTTEINVEENNIPSSSQSSRSGEGNVPRKNDLTTRVPEAPRNEMDDPRRYSTPTSGEVVYASESDELVALIVRTVGQKPDRRLVREIGEQLELRGATLREYIDDIRSRLPRLREKPGFGFFLHHAKKWGGVDSALASEPRTKEQAERQSGACKRCRNVGRLDDGQYCDCPMAKDLERVERRAAKKRQEQATQIAGVGDP